MSTNNAALQIAHEVREKISVRNYRSSDWQAVLSWWTESREVAPLETMMPIESSFIAEIDGVPALAVTLYLTNTKELCYAENFIGNPALKGEDRRQATKILLDHVTNFARELGYRRILCMTEKPVLVERYKEIGFIPTLGGLTAFVRST